MKKDPKLDVYFVTDRGLLKGRPIEDIVDAAVKGGATIVQLREKECSTREFMQAAKRIKRSRGHSEWCRWCGCRVIYMRS